jgi:hypothetical protein
MTKPVLIIDGNNLAHWVYSITTNPLSPTDSERLARHLAQYAMQYKRQISRIEVCFDRDPLLPDLLPGLLQILSADPPWKADDVVLGRHRFHVYQGNPVVVITNDGEIQDEISRSQGHFLSVYHFVIQTGMERPVFLPPKEFSLRLSGVAQKSTRDEIGNMGEVLQHQQDKMVRGEKRDSKIYTNPTARARKKERQARLIQDVTIQRGVNEDQPPVDLQQSVTLLVPESQPEPIYRLSLETWPIEAGARFLLHSFCAQHRKEYALLVKSIGMSNMRSEDLRGLATDLEKSCGSETDFTRRGSLMDRVRLALIKEGGELSLSQLADQAGIKVEGLQGRIKKKAEGWITRAK